MTINNPGVCQIDDEYNRLLCLADHTPERGKAIDLIHQATRELEASMLQSVETNDPASRDVA